MCDTGPLGITTLSLGEGSELEVDELHRAVRPPIEGGPEQSSIGEPPNRLGPLVERAGMGMRPLYPLRTQEDGREQEDFPPNRTGATECGE